VTIDGPGDKPEYKVLWAAHASVAVELYRGLNDFSDDPETLCNFIESFSYASGAKGVAVAALTGDAIVFRKYVAKLKALHPTYCSGLADIYTAAFFLAAPFPVRSAKRALQAAQAAVLIAPNSRRNNYYAGLAALKTGDKAAAAAFFESALLPTATAESQSELDISELLEKEARRGLTFATTPS
jgi:hypothetical protein